MRELGRSWRPSGEAATSTPKWYAFSDSRDGPKGAYRWIRRKKATRPGSGSGSFTGSGTTRKPLDAYPECVDQSNEPRSVI